MRIHFIFHWGDLMTWENPNYTCRKANASTHTCKNTHTRVQLPPWSSHCHFLTCTLSMNHMKLPCETHTYIQTHCCPTPTPRTPICTMPNVSIHITVQYPGSTQRQTREHFPFILTEPYIHNTIMFAQRWAEKKDPHWYTCSNGISVWETHPWQSDRI